jgi:hypothetical protein
MKSVILHDKLTDLSLFPPTKLHKLEEECHYAPFPLLRIVKPYNYVFVDTAPDMDNCMHYDTCYGALQ